ncbi:DUF805 domain-containing protein [Bifidobacterium scaligerum]|uniref:DUF805 domain-containing protein n=1 Tax=Bifidobacterium scaligerum TaxID=2052656 RepID=A0A2M9HQG0_9BIFI|nr:DUF805 domain-containing protein [Bifidobacterium scaligerum]PJM79056.1 DUF805 domain-containing protein [Bifidobacterium scaligerum]
MTDPNHAPIPQVPTPNGANPQNTAVPPVPQYGTPAPAQSVPPAYGQQQPVAPAGQPTYPQTPANQQPFVSAPAPGYTQPAPNAAFNQTPPAYNQYTAPNASPSPAPGAGVPLDQPYYDCPFPEAFLRFWKKFVVFSGRASRSEFWWWTLANAGISLVLSGLSSATDGDLAFISNLWLLATIIPGIALAVRRLHDTNRPGWLVAIFYGASALGIIIMLAGGGAAVYGGIGSLTGSSGYGAMAAGGVGAMFFGWLLMLAGGIVYIVFMALPSKPEGARFDAQPGAQQFPFGTPSGPAPASPAAPGFAPGAPAPDFNQFAAPAPAAPAPAANNAAAPSDDLNDATVLSSAYAAPAPTASTPAAPASTVPAPAATHDDDLEDGATVLSPHATPAGNNAAQQPWQGQ